MRVKPAAEGSAPFRRREDYELDGFWATLGRTSDSAIAEGQAVFVDYVYTPFRLDSVVVSEEGRVSLVAGNPGLGSILPPKPGQNETVLANIWIQGEQEKLTSANLYPIDFGSPAGQLLDPTVAERLLPGTLAKLKAGASVKIVAWGDSVTNGGGVGPNKELWYQNQISYA